MTRQRRPTPSVKSRAAPRFGRGPTTPIRSADKQVVQLRRRLNEAIAQQAAMADVLKIISRSHTNIQLVLDTIAEIAQRLCRSEQAYIMRLHHGRYHVTAAKDARAERVKYLQDNPIASNRSSVAGRCAIEQRTIQIKDATADPEYSLKMTGDRPYRTILGVPLVREGISIGVIVLTRSVVKSFSQQQIKLVSSFADHALIAIENARLFDEVQEVNRQLAEASQHKSQFLANMSHELRTPLNAILGYTELVADGIYGETPAKAQEVLKRVESNGRHLLGLINDVLDLSKIEAGQLKLSLDEYSMKDVVDTVFGAVEPLAAKKKLGLKVDVPPDMPAGHGDERRLTQVLLNLVGNAIKFTDIGEVAIRVSASNGSISVAVQDTGPGIDPADQAKLFEEFHQVDNSITKTKGGTGLGLAISRRIVELHGGRLWVDSRPGDGSIFTFTVPTTVKQQARLS